MALPGGWGAQGTPGGLVTFFFLLAMVGVKADGDGADSYAFRGIAQRSKTANCSLYLSPNETAPCWATPLYSDLNGSMWENPALDNYSATWAELDPEEDFIDADPSDVNGLCDPTDAFDQSKCCRPAPGCLPTRGFNWILSTCIGTTCGDWYVRLARLQVRRLS